MDAIEVEIDEDIFLPCYRHLIDTPCNINFLWGGRDSGKSYFIAQALIKKCLQADYFRCVLIKKTAVSIKDSQWQLIKDIVEEWGIGHLFDFKTSPLTITCKNGNKFIARGCDQPEKLKSITDLSDAWYEEGNQLTESDYIVVSTTLRSNKGVVQEHFSFNPECDGSYEDFWLYKMFFKEHYERNEHNFTGEIKFEYKGIEYVKTYTSTHTTYQDNPNCPIERIATHESWKNINPYYYTIYTQGLWGTRTKGGEVLKAFSVKDHIGFVEYDKTLAIHASFDENVVPYFPCGLFQIKHVGESTELRMIDEIVGYHPNNKVGWVCRQIEARYPGHEAGVFVYGDATSQKDDVKQERGHDLFYLIMNELKIFKPVRRVATSNPSVVMSLNFFNAILGTRYRGISFFMDERCKTARRDFESTKEAPDGGIDKKKVHDKDTNQSYQPFGHYVDLTRYFITYACASDYDRYKRGDKPNVIRISKRTTRNQL
ncbi:MAG: PBSX family phage terminase large subunit [Legionellales bacterium]